MKKKIFFCITLLFCLLEGKAQVPNGNFEDWLGTNPFFWESSNNYLPVSDTSIFKAPGISGWGVKMKNYDHLGKTQVAVMMSYSAINHLPAHLNFYYKYFQGSQWDDGLLLAYIGNISGLDTAYIGSAQLIFEDTASSWTPVQLTFDYCQAPGLPFSYCDQQADTASVDFIRIVAFVSTDTAFTHLDSELWLDELDYLGYTGIEEMDNKKMETISDRLIVHDICGKRIGEFSGNDAWSAEEANFPGGLYLIQYWQNDQFLGSQKIHIP